MPANGRWDLIWHLKGQNALKALNDLPYYLKSTDA
jgi:hypothetical protein